MTARKEPKVSLKGIAPERLIAFAEAHGWQIFPLKRTDLKTCFKWRGDEFFQALIPLDATLSDYDVAMLRACEVLAEGEGREFKKTIYDFSFLDD